MSIKKSLRILLIMTSMIPLILVAIIAYVLLTNRLVETSTQNILRTAQTSKTGIESMIEIQRREVSLLSLQEDLMKAVQTSNRGGPIPLDNINALLQKRCNTLDSCEHISLYNINNEIIASSDPSFIGKETKSGLTLSYMLATKSTAIAVDGIRPFVKDGKVYYSMDIGAPIIDSDQGSIYGYIISSLNVSYFEKFLSPINIGDTGFCILLDKNGNVIYHPDRRRIGLDIKSEKLSTLVEHYNKGQISSSGTFQYYFDRTSQVYGYSVLPKQNWVLLVKQDLPEIRLVTTIMMTILFVICGVLLILIIIFANSLARKISYPIIALRDAMRTASDGDLNVQSNIRNNNELGELSKNFNKMLHIIKTNYEDLESMHEELLANEEQLRSNYDHIEFLAYHDTLTNLPNKLAFLDHVNAVLASSSQEDKIHAVYFVDLDNFKTVNDTLGHEYGDTLLVKTSQMLTTLMGGNGMLARAGGDEFLLFKEAICFMDFAVEFASQILETFRSPVELEGEIVYVSMSIGISIYPENGISSKTLIKNSDIAMYKSKDTGKNKFTLFDKTMEEELNRNTMIIEVLRNAIENEDIYIQYQPLVELETNNIIGFEALMRIRNERLGQLAPSEFIPIAEESGLIIELSSWLLKEACFFNKKIIDLGYQPRSVSVNISSVQINRPGFIATLSKILEETQLPPQYLELEITESTLVSSIMDATMLLNTLQELGVRVSLDDFGTGYSSLNYLTNMPINTLKIDKSFVDNITTSEKDAHIAESIIQLAHSLDITVVAEGVETEEQLASLKSKHCDIIQGYIYSHPLHPGELLEIIKDDELVTQCTLF